MLEFREITLEDQDWITELLGYSDYMGCEYSFANNMAWRRLYQSTICRFQDFYINKSEDKDGFYFTFPAGRGDITEAVYAMREYANAHGRPLVLIGVTEPVLAVMQEKFPDAFTATLPEESADYIYLAEDLRTLAGRKYHQKRNHLKRFQAYGAVYAPLTQADFDDCIVFSSQQYAEKGGIDDFSSQNEQFAIHTFFSNFDRFGLMGATLRVDGKLVAFSIAEKLNSNTLCVHIEKADVSFEGAYAAINNTLVLHAAGEEILYVNREEDLGIPGLRKAKQSYHPTFMLQKYRLVQNHFS